MQAIKEVVGGESSVLIDEPYGGLGRILRLSPSRDGLVKCNHLLVAARPGDDLRDL